MTPKVILERIDTKRKKSKICSMVDTESPQAFHEDIPQVGSSSIKVDENLKDKIDLTNGANLNYAVNAVQDEDLVQVRILYEHKLKIMI